MAVSKIAGLFVSLDLNFAKFTEGLNKARTATDRQTSQIAKALGSVRTAFTGLGIGIGAAGIVQGLRSVVNASLDFESSFTGIRKTVKATEPELQAISNAFIQMSKAIPVTTTELNNIGSSAGQLGIKTQNIVKFTRVMADLGVTTNLSSTEAAQSLARLANITGLSQDKFDRLGSVIVELGNNMATTEAEIVAMGLRLAGAGKQIGLTEGETLAFAAALSSVGIEAEAGGSAISKVFVQIAQAVATGNSELELFAKVAGLSAQEFAKEFRADASGVIVKFIEGLNGISKAGGNVFGVLEEIGIVEVRMRDALLRSAGAGDLLRKSLTLQAGAWEKNNALTRESQTFYSNSANQIQVLKNQLSAVAKTVGDAVVPQLLALLNGIKQTIETTVQLKDGLSLAFGAVLVQQIVTSTVAIRAFGNALVAVQILSAVRSLEGLRIALGAIVPAAGAALAALNTLVVPAAVASFAVLVTEMYKTGKAEQDLHDNTVQLSTITSRMSRELQSKYGVEITRAGKSLEQWNFEVVEAMKLHSGLSATLNGAADSANSSTETNNQLAESVSGISKEVARLQKILGIPIEFGPVKITASLNDLIAKTLGNKPVAINVPISATLDPLHIDSFAAIDIWEQNIRARLEKLQGDHDFAVSIGGVMDTEFQKELFEGAAEAAKLTVPEIKKATEATNDYAHAISSGLEAAMLKWEGFGKLVTGVLNDIAATILRNSVTAPLTTWLSDTLSGLGKSLSGGRQVASSAADIALPLVGGFFASGGQPPIGKMSVVGERGPELFVPNTAGTIIPNGQFGGGQQTVINYNIDARGAGPGVDAEIRRALRDVEDRAVMRSVRTVHDLKLRTA